MSIAWLTLIVSLLITVWAWHLAQAGTEQKAHDRFHFRIDAVKTAIAERLRDYEAVLRGAQGLFNASDEVTREEWRAYVRSLKLDQVYPGIQGIGFVRRVFSPEKDAHIRKIRAEGFPGYTIWPRGERAEYLSVIYLEPFAGRNLRAFGYDVSSEPARRVALEQARDTGEAAISGKITLAQETGENKQAGFLLVLPIYRKGASTDTAEGRRAGLFGYVDIAFRMDDLMRGTLSANVPDVDVEIFDGAGMTKESLMYDHDLLERFNQSHDKTVFSHTTSLVTHGHVWTLYFSSLPAFEASIDKDKPRLVLAGGTFISLLFFIIAWSLVSKRAGVIAANESLKAEISEREREKEMLRQVAQALSVATDESFFRELVSNLARALQVDYAFVGELDPNRPDTVRTLAFCNSGRIVANIDYRLTHDTPCGSVECKSVCYFPDGARKLFPEDDLIYRYGVETFVGHPLLDSAGRVLGLLVVMHEKPIADIDHVQSLLQICARRVAAELERRQAQAHMHQLSSVVEQTADSVVITDRDGVIQYVNPAYETITGYSQKEAIGKKTSILKSGRHDKGFYDRLWDTILRGEVFRDRFINRKKDGSLYDEEKTITPLKDNDGKITHFVSTGKDITQRVEAENENKRMQSFLDSVVENLPNMLFVKDAKDLRFVRFNRAAEELLGYSRDEMLGKSDYGFFTKEEADFFTFKDRQVLNGNQTHDIPEEPVHTRHQGVRLLHTKKIPILDESGKPLYLLGISEDITERKRAEKALAQSAAEWTYSMDFIEDAMYLIDADDKVIRANRAFYQLTGLSPDQTIGRDITSIMHPQGEPTPCRVCQARRARRDCHIIMEPQDPDNPTGCPIEVTMRVIRDAAGAFTGVLMDIRDLTHIRETERVLRESEASLSHAQRIAHLGNWDWNIATGELRWSDEIYRIFGLTPQRFGATYEAFLSSVHPDDRQSVTEAVNNALNEKAPYSIYHRIMRPDGTERIVHEQAEVAFDDAGKVIRMIGTVQDVTERKQTQERLNYLAHHDPLTGLPNRVLLQDRLKQAMLEADRNERLVATLFLDLDRFKTINDTLGHQIGDALLKAVAGRLATCLRAGDTVSRLGGDEFTIILANVAHVDDITRVAQKILDQFISPFRIGGRDLFVSPSIGITLYPLDEKDPENLLKDADVAMYHAKELGGNVFQFYTPELNARAARRLELETGLRHALERQEFILHYQPLVDMKTGRIRGMEALLRWQHPEFGLIPPLDFIPLAEETGLIIPIGEWVLKTACAQIKAWHDTGFPALQVAINLSSKQLRDKNLIAAVKLALTESGLEPRYLDLELTESVLMQDMELAATILKELKAVGISFSLDDFGTGYSSLSYLKRFPIDYLKIDRSFVRDITTDAVGAGLVKAIIAMANVLHIKVIAEGVETYEQLEFLRRHGCDITQGYFCSKPLAAGEFTELLQDWDRLRAGKCSIEGQRNA